MAEEKVSAPRSPAQTFKVPDTGMAEKAHEVALLAPKTPNISKEVSFTATPPDSAEGDTRKENRAENMATPATTRLDEPAVPSAASHSISRPSDTSAISKLLTAAQLQKMVSSTRGLETPSRSTWSASAANMYMTPASSNSARDETTTDELMTPVRPRAATHNNVNGVKMNNDDCAIILHSPKSYPTKIPSVVHNAQLARKKRRRTSPMELQILEEEFSRCPKPSKTLREDIARRVDMTEKAVQIWFQNRRQAVRKQELLFSASSNDGGSSDTGGPPLTPAPKFRPPVTPATGKDKGLQGTPAHKFPSEGVIQYRIDGYQHKVSQPVSVTATMPSNNTFSEGLLMNNHKLGSINKFDTKDPRTQSMPIKSDKFTIYSDADTDEETEANSSQSFDTRYSMARPTISSVRSVASPTAPPPHKRQLVVARKLKSPKKSGVASLRLSMSSNGEAQVVVERVLNGCAVRPVPLTGKAKQVVSSIKEEEEGMSEAKRATNLLRSKLAKSLIKAQLAGDKKLKSPSKRRTAAMTPPQSPSKHRRQLAAARRSPLSPRKALLNALALSPSKRKRKAGTQFSAAAFPALPKSRSFTSALLMRHQAPPSLTARRTRSPGGSPSKSPRDIPSSPPFRLPARPTSAASSSSSSSSASGSPPSRKQRAVGFPPTPETSKHKFSLALANATVAASAAAKADKNVLAFRPTASRHSQEISSGSSSNAESAERPKKKPRVKPVETREAECINNLLSLRSGDWT